MQQAAMVQVKRIRAANDEHWCTEKTKELPPPFPSAPKFHARQTVQSTEHSSLKYPGGVIGGHESRTDNAGICPEMRGQQAQIFVMHREELRLQAFLQRIEEQIPRLGHTAADNAG